MESPPFQLVNRLSRHRGGQVAYYASGSYGTGLWRAVDYALWDLCGKHLGLPLYELLGGASPEVPVYASGLAYPASDEEVVELYKWFAGMGIEAAKVKVGFPTVERDIERLTLVRDAFDSGCTLMADANEAWSPKEAIRRLRAYRDAGLDLYWIEDPTYRESVDGIRQVVDAVPFTYVNTGEYCGFEGKRRLVENGASDVLNVHGISPARKAAHLATAYGVPLSTGTDHAADHCAVHMGAALPKVEYTEFVHQRFYDLAGEPFTIEDGNAIAPDRPGHRVELPDDVLREYGEGVSER